MMKKSTKLFMTGAATLLGVALATGGAYAATGSLTTVDAPGRVLHVSGVGPASEHASPNGLEHANPNAKGLFGWSTGSTHGPKVKDDSKDKAAKDKAVDKVVGDKPAKAVKPVPDKSPTKNQPSSSVEDDDDENENESSGHVEAVAPDDAVEVEHDSDDSDDSEDSEDSHDSDDESDESDEKDESDESDD